MGCSTCSTKSGKPNGCKSNGACSNDGCNKLTVFNWLANMQIPNHEETTYVEVRFKNNRKIYYKNERNLQLNIGDVVAVESSPGHDIGIITLTGELVKLQMHKKKVFNYKEEPKIVYRIASQKDIDKWQEFRDKEHQYLLEVRQIIKRLKVPMKLADVEYQGDGTKAIFYYTAENRVDFRLLVKELASTFGVRVEMKQIGFRQEAALVGGIGSCGRELCCSTWLTDFRTVNTTAARYQQLSINPQKLAGQCGKLKCCLNFELDSYLEALSKFPKTEISLKTKKGNAHFQKMDIFKGLLWYSFKENPMQWHTLKIDDAKDIIQKNAKGIVIEDIEEYVFNQDSVLKVNFENAVGEDSIDRFNTPKRKKKRRANNTNKKPNSRGRTSNKSNTTQGDSQKRKSENAKNPAQKPNTKNSTNRTKTNNNNKPHKKPNTPQKKVEKNTTEAKTKPKQKRKYNNKRKPSQNKQNPQKKS